jgi:2-oxoglutarate dehydrogenase E2 component (dihydrolipoamide succinyltransferase)
LADITLPSLGESVTEGIITRWFKQVGDRVERDEPILEVSTDKVDSEMPSPAAGILMEILIVEGETASVGARLGIIGDADASAPLQGDAIPAAVEIKVEAKVPVVAPSGGARVQSPLVRRILANAQISASSVSATGIGGRITRGDALRSATLPKESGIAGVAHPPMSAHIGMSVEVDFSNVERVVTADKTAFAYVARAVVLATAEHAWLNASFDGSVVSGQPDVNLGIALSVGDALVAPVVQHAQTRSFQDLVGEIDAMTKRALGGAAKVMDLLGGTITLVPPASGAVDMALPIVQPTQVAALSLGTITKRAWIIDPDGDELIAVRPIGTITLAIEPRALRSDVAAQYLARIKELLETRDWSKEQ